MMCLPINLSSSTAVLLHDSRIIAVLYSSGQPPQQAQCSDTTRLHQSTPMQAHCAKRIATVVSAHHDRHNDLLRRLPSTLLFLLSLRWYTSGENIGNHEGPRETALQMDASPYVEPLLSELTPGLLGYYPRVPYSKGAAVLQMLEGYFNSAHKDTFRVSCCVLEY